MRRRKVGSWWEEMRRGGWKRPGEPLRPLPGDLWRAAGRRLWPPPLNLIGRPGGERRRAWCEGMVGRGGGQEATGAVIGGSRHWTTSSSSKKTGSRTRGRHGMHELDQKCTFPYWLNALPSILYCSNQKFSMLLICQRERFVAVGFGVCHVK